MKKEIKYLCFLLLFITGCANIPEPTRIDMGDRLMNCKVYSDRYECGTIDYNVYYISKSKLMFITTWDSSAWKENMAYCPKSLPIENIINATLQCDYNEVCLNPTTNNWTSCI